MIPPTCSGGSINYAQFYWLEPRSINQTGFDAFSAQPENHKRLIPSNKFKGFSFVL